METVGKMRKRAREYHIEIGSLPPGVRNQITDVPGVRVGHATIINAYNRTGVTVILPGEQNPFTHKMPAASYVLNGFGKSAGMMQIDELGTIEAPIALTSTLNVGLVTDAMVEYMLNRCKEEGIAVRSINIPVLECNDGVINHVDNRAVKKEHVFEAIQNAQERFEEGAVGGGTGMMCFGLKGGIGSSSRVVTIGAEQFTVGIFVQTNYGALPDLQICGCKTGEQIALELTQTDQSEKGSVIVVAATDAPLSSRQLRRMLKRVGNGLARGGSYTSHGSGEVFLGFSTANVIETNDVPFTTVRLIKDEYLNPFFRATAEAVEEAVLNSMLCADAANSIDGIRIHSLAEFAKYFPASGR